MIRFTKNYKILLSSLGFTGLALAVKATLHILGWEFMVLTPLHTAVISGGIFVMSFVLSAVIADYKESEKLPAEFAATIESMYEDIKGISIAHPEVNLREIQATLCEILTLIREDVVTGNRQTHHKVFELSTQLADMEQKGVPPNYLAKLKQEQALLVRSLFRINYIQTIKFLPSAHVLAQLVIVLISAILLFTKIDPVVTGTVITGVTILIFSYILLLIETVSKPFQAAGATIDDVSFFLIDRTIEHVSEAQHSGHEQAGKKSDRKSTLRKRR